MSYSESLSNTASAAARPIKVLIVDDSALVRQVLSRIFEQATDIEVVATAVDPYDAREKIKQYRPDVLTLDVEMPRMDGITFLTNLMRLRPMPVVMISSLTEKGGETTMRALEIGAIDFVCKPQFDVAYTLEDYAEEIINKVRFAFRAPLPVRDDARLRAIQTERPAVPTSHTLKTTDRVIAIGASTGGTEAIREVLETMPPDAPGIVIAQHIPPVFSRSFAERMNLVTPLSAVEAKDGQQIMRGHVYIAPGDYHLAVRRDGAHYTCVVHQQERVNRHRPSVDVLFKSVAEEVRHNAVGVILTGMGNDGAQGLLDMREAGAPTMVQDEATSVVWGMPGQAVKLGAADTVLPLPKIAAELLTRVKP